MKNMTPLAKFNKRSKLRNFIHYKRDSNGIVSLKVDENVTSDHTDDLINSFTLCLALKTQ